MKQVLFLILVFLFSFTSCKKDVSNPIDINTVPPTPTLATPRDTASNIAVLIVLTWNESSGATSYTLQVSASSSFSSFVFNKSDITATSQQITGLSLVTKYYWRVSAANNYGTKGWSETWSFTTTATPFSCGTSIVDYAGKTYNTIQVGTQCWLKENLDVGVYVASTNTGSIHSDVADNGIIEKYCFDNNTANCATYGGLYDWNEAMAYSTTPGTKGICPIGWHIPTQAEFVTLKAAVGNDGNKLKREDQGTGSGVGTNTSGFSALLAGGRGSIGYFGNLGNLTSFWSSTEYNASNAYYLYLWSYDSSINMYNYPKDYGFSIRCLKD